MQQSYSYLGNITYCTAGYLACNMQLHKRIALIRQLNKQIVKNCSDESETIVVGRHLVR